MVYYFCEFSGPLNEAVEYFKKQIAYPEGTNGRFAIEDEDRPIAEIWVVPAEQAVKIDVTQMVEEHQDREAKKKLRDQEERERAEYERLKKRFG